MLSEKVIKNKAREFRQGGKDMRIAMLTNNYRPFVGGVPISVERQAEELIKLGHQVTVFAPMYGENTRRKRGSSGSRCFCSRAGCTLRNAET